MMQLISTVTPLASAAEPRSRCAADAACAGGRGDWRRKAENQICHRPESGYRSGSINVGRLESASTKGFGGMA